MNLNKTDSMLRILLVEDSEHDRNAFKRAFKKSQISYSITECERSEEAIQKLRTDASSFDILVSDHGMPGMSGLDFLKELIANKTTFPLVLLTGSGSEQIAVEALKAGIDDYIIKDDYGGYLELLPVTLQKIVEKYNDKVLRIQAEEEREKLVYELKRALDDVKKLSGLLPICASCKKIRDDNGYWTQIESYIKKNSEADFTHSICPGCHKTLYPDINDNKDK
tara:strand:- start:521 stop:1189 length:669 start_codon:yes stop_codon:yes gene_type:complete